MKRLRVANVIEEGKLAGPQLRLMLVASELHREVNTVVLMPEENSERFSAKCKELGIPCRLLPLTRITKEWRVAIRYVPLFLFEIRSLIRELEAGSFDLVHVSGGAWQFKGIIAARLARIPVVWHLNDTSMPWFIRLIFRFLARWADGFIFASERSRNYYGPLVRDGRPEFLIPAPVDTAAYAPNAEFAPEPENTNWKGRVIIATLANVSPVKNIELALETASQLEKDCSDALFVIAGPVHARQRGYFRRLEQLRNHLGLSNVVFLGARDDPRGFLERADIYLCCSRAESSPMAVWEAMSMETPVVGTDVGDLMTNVAGSGAGYIVGSGNPSALAEPIRRLVADPDLRRELGRQARRVAVERFSLRACAEQHLEAYRTIARG